jgi:hypothetical protein
MARRWTLLAVLLGGLLLGIALRSALLAVGRFAFVLLLVAVAVAIGLLTTATPAYRRSKIGVGSRVLEQRLDAGDADSSICVSCDAPIETGVRRRFVREWVAFGVPLVLLESGENHYCEACAETTITGAASVATEVERSTR